MMTSHFSLRQYILWGGFFFVTLVLLCSGCSKQVKEAQNKSGGYDPVLRSQDPPNGGVTRGQKLFETLGCMGCHTVNGKGGNVGPDLTDEGNKGRTRQWLTTQIENPRTNDPQTIMPAFTNMTNEQVNDLVDYLMSLTGKQSSKNDIQDNNEAPSKSTNISLSAAGEMWSDICGQCHNLRPPSEYSDAQWTAAVDQMRLLVPLTGQEQREVLEFLKASN